MSKTRNYSCKDVEMLLTAKTIAQSFRSNIKELSPGRTDWTEQYATDLNVRIDKAIETYFGIDSKKDLRNASIVLDSIQVPARRDLSFFKTQIDDDFKKDPNRRDELLKTLGFSRHLREVQTGNQESLIQLLHTFRQNMNDSIRKAIAEKGLNQALIDNIIAYASNFENANITQETFKSSSKVVTKEVSDSFNSIYDEIIGICKKVASFYHYEPLKAEQFTFKKVLKNLGSARKAVVVA
jgi:hypothetical protein